MSPLKLNGSTSGFVALDAPAAAGSNTLVLPTGNGSNGQVLTTNGSGTLSWSTVTSSQWTTTGSDIYYTTGKVLVGTSTSSLGTKIHVQGSTSPTSATAYDGTVVVTDGATDHVALYAHNSSATGTTNGTVQIRLAPGGNGQYTSRIVAGRDGDFSSSSTAQTNLQFWTSPGGGVNSERMRIASDGSVFIGKTGYGLGTAGIELQSNGQSYFTRSGAQVIIANRLSSDGDVIGIYQDTVQEGSISVSGTTVTYGGGHLARWSQLPNDEDPSALLKGTVMSNLDEMCEWGEEDNEQLNKTKVSDVEGDPNVAGVFVAASPSEDGPFDFFVGMTGDMIIRIAEGVTVERGDLLMSAGDGTAKPQDDDIIRSKTIAKVTSTHVTCTYDDGSYCVPCVLMAC